MRTGQVDINGGGFNAAAPFGGYGQSGNGRERGEWGIDGYLETKSIQLLPSGCRGERRVAGLSLIHI